jgi:hypothetical protein
MISILYPNFKWTSLLFIIAILGYPDFSFFVLWIIGGSLGYGAGIWAEKFDAIILWKGYLVSVGCAGTRKVWIHFVGSHELRERELIFAVKVTAATFRAIATPIGDIVSRDYPPHDCRRIKVLCNLKLLVRILRVSY